MVDEPRQGAPSVRVRRLARTLAGWRAESGKTLEEVAKEVGWSRSKQSRIESASAPIAPVDVLALAMYFERPGGERETTFQEARVAAAPHWWDRAPVDAFFPDVRDYIALEAEAAEVHTYKVDVVPGLFQTEDYARAVEQASFFADERGDEGWDEICEHRVRARLLRQDRLREEVPLEVRAVLAEAALHVRVGGDKTWRGQLERLAELMALPNVELRILRNSAGAHPAMGYPFTLLRFDGDEPDVCYIELLRSGLYVEREAELRPYRLAFDDVWERAAGQEKSRELVEALMSADAADPGKP